MYLTPVIYPMKTEGLFGLLMKLNPMASLITETRNWLTVQPSYDLNMFFTILIASFFVFILGLVIYKISMPMIIERIGSWLLLRGWFVNLMYTYSFEKLEVWQLARKLLFRSVKTQIEARCFPDFPDLFRDLELTVDLPGPVPGSQASKRRILIR